MTLLDEMRRVLGPEHPDTLATRANLAVARYRHGRQAEAVADLRSLLADLRSSPESNEALAGRVSRLFDEWTQED